MTPTTVLILVAALAVIAAIVFVAVVIGIHSESHHREMTTHTQRPLAALVRRFLGVYVGKPTNTNTDADDREECLTGNSTVWWDNGGAL